MSDNKPHIKKLSEIELKELIRIIDRRLKVDYTQEEYDKGVEIADFRTYYNLRTLYGHDLIDKLIQERIEALTEPTN